MFQMEGDSHPLSNWPKSLSNTKTMPDYIPTTMATPESFFPPLSCRLRKSERLMINIILRNSLCHSRSGQL